MDNAAAPGAETFWSRDAWTGTGYRMVLKRFHETFKPRTYLEIGVDTGKTLEIAQCASIAVDPEFSIEAAAVNNKPSCYFFRCGSDRFFLDHDPSALLGGPVEMAFLDGMHYFEFLLRDFINTEKHCRRNSIVFLHDCLPVDAYVARRDRSDGRHKPATAFPGWWAGDVWKTAAILKAHRPDLKIVTFNAGPTGLLAITNLDPRSTVLEERYFELTAEYARRDLSDAETREAYFASMNVIDFAAFEAAGALSAEFWL